MPQAINPAGGAAPGQPDIAFMSRNRSEPNGVTNRRKPSGCAGCESYTAVQTGIKLTTHKRIKLFRIHTIGRNSTSGRQTAGCRPRVAVVSREKCAQPIGTPHNTARIGCSRNGSTAVCAETGRIVISLEPIRAAIKREG